MKKEILTAGGQSILNCYKGSLFRAMSYLYPELKLNQENLVRFREKWKSPQHQGKFLEEVAKSKQVNPLDKGRELSVAGVASITPKDHSSQHHQGFALSQD